MELGFLNGGGRASELIRKVDWSAHALGPPQGWPPALKSNLSLVLNSPESMILSWFGPDDVLYLFFNETYFPLLGPRLDWAMGERFDKVWADAWAQAKPIIDDAMAGKTQRFVDLPWKLDTDRGPEDTFWSFSYSRVLDEEGEPAGLFIFTNETTARVEADRALTDSQEQLRLEVQRQRHSLQQMPGFVALLTGPTHVFTYVNDAYVEVAGARDYVGRSVRQVFPELEGQGFHELLDQVFASGRPFASRAMPIQLADREGAKFLDFVYQPVRDDEGVVNGIFVGGYDVTEIIRAQAALGAREARYRTLFNTIDEGFCVVEFIDGPNGPLSDYVHVEANAAYTQQAGIPDVVGKRLREVIPEEADIWLARFGGVLTTGEPIRFEQELVATGRVLELAAFRVEPPSRREVAVLFQDITARRRAEAELKGLAETLELRVAERTAERDRMWSLSPDLMVVVGPDGRYVSTNPAWRSTLGYESEELLGLHATDLAHPEDLPVTREALRAARGQALPTFENRFRHKEGGYRWIQWLAVPGGDEVFAIGRNVTEARETEGQLAQIEEALRQSQKMEAVGQLTGGLAHDFNNLLAGISGSLELMQARIDQGRVNDVPRYVSAAQGAARRAAALTHRLLAFSRRQTLDPRPTNLITLVAGMEELIRRTVGPGVHVEVVGASGLWPTLVDPPQLENALLNLCINARDAMPDGGRLTIETANKWVDEHAARQHELSEGQYVSLCVSDTGSGMTPDVIEKAFEPFFTTKPIGEGTGLGLSMIYGFAKQSGGQVRIYSEVGSGTTVCIYLPRHLGDVAEADPLAAISSPIRTERGETVLVVDDEPTVRMLITEVLDDLGYTAIEAADSVSGLKILQSDIPIDLLITDVGLPGGMNGRQMADAGRVRRPGLKVLFITGYAENAVLGNGQLDPGMAILTKPFVMDALGARIREMITSRA